MLTGLLIGAAFGLACASPPPPPPPPVALPTVEVIHEDDPRWDCHTMGNRTCGLGHYHPDGTGPHDD